MLSSVKGSHKAYKEHIDTEKKEAKRKVNLLTAKEEEIKKRQEKDAKQLEELKKQYTRLRHQKQELKQCSSQPVDFWQKEMRE